MKNTLKRALALLIAACLVLCLAACGSGSSGTAGTETAGTSAQSGSEDNVVNIGATGTLGSLNPLLIDSTWINMYAITMMYSPLAALNADAEFDMILADSITTEDNIHYTIHIDDSAVWSDGEPITAEDLAWTMRYLASPVIANPNMMLYALEGTDDDTGYLPEGVDEFAGVTVVDDKTCEFTFKYEMNMVSFLNGYAQYIFVLPKHVLQDIPEDELATSTWFNAPTVVSGPYIATSVDANHYITYDANGNYWRGTVNIAHANIRIVDGSELLAGLQSGEIDVIPPLLGTIPDADYESVLGLDGVTAEYGAAYSVESLFINTNVISDVRVRQAMLLALDRQTIIDGLLSGAGEICDGFAVKDGPYWSDVTATGYDVEAAKALIAEAEADGWDSSVTYQLYINSGEPTLINAAALVQSYWAEIGVNVQINTVDLDALMTEAGTDECAVLGVQYTYPPVDPSWDIQWVLGDWCYYYPDEISDALNVIWNSNDTAEMTEQYHIIDTLVQENVPVIDLYVNGPLGAVSSRISGASATMYGCLNNIHEWTIAG